MGGMTPPAAADALLNLLFPFWQLVIGCCVLLATVAAAVRLARRGPSRMGTALLVVGTAIVALTVIGVLASGR
jgi:hypothetical protein